MSLLADAQAPVQAAMQPLNVALSGSSSPTAPCVPPKLACSLILGTTAVSSESGPHTGGVLGGEGGAEGGGGDAGGGEGHSSWWYGQPRHAAAAFPLNPTQWFMPCSPHPGTGLASCM